LTASKTTIAIRNKRTSMSDKEDAEKWRQRQAEELLKLFEEDTGSPATSKEELAAWLSSARGDFAVEKNAKLLQRKDHSKN
jgi:hypothetical protein